MVSNVHSRDYRTTGDRLGAILDSLSTADDMLWPVGDWPPVVLSDGLDVGSEGGHGPVRYTVEQYEPGAAVRFRFTGPRGFNGTHSFEVEPAGEDRWRLTHRIEMKVGWPATISWPLAFRPMHDALMEDALDKVATALDSSAYEGRPWSAWVKFIRKQAARRQA